MLGTVTEIWRYPVKSMAGEKLTRAQVNPNGILGDRAWALRNDEVGEFQGGKKFPDMMKCIARFRSEPDAATIPPVDISLPDGSTTASDASDLPERLKTITDGVAASLWSVPPPDKLDFYRRAQRGEAEFMSEIEHMFQRAPGEPLPDLAQFPPELMEFTSFPGMFFDATPINLLSTAALRHMSALNPASNWDARRFRPNFLIEPGETLSALVEHQWLGRRLKVGSLVLDCVMPTPRCSMVTQSQDGLAFDAEVLRAVVRQADQNMGVYATVVAPGEVSVGDRLELA
ncbi:MAG: MOSC domain-containing protein [Panacagrimonas sp.]